MYKMCININTIYVFNSFLVVTLKSYNRALFTIIHDIYIHYSALSCFYHRYLVAAAAAACVNFGVVNCTCVSECG